MGEALNEMVPEDGTPESRARESEPETVAERVAVIADMMERLEWVRGKSAKELAGRWGCAVSTVENYSSEAHRRITADADEAQRDITVGCRQTWKTAVQSGDAQAMKAIGSLWLDVSGARAPNKQELTGKDGAPINGPVIYVPAESDD